MRKRCRICHVMADLDENGRCSFCNDVYMASQLNNDIWEIHDAERRCERHNGTARKRGTAMRLL